MELRARIRPLPRRAAMMAACAALLVAALAAAIAPSAQAAKKRKTPVVTKVSPLDVAVGEKLTIRGRNFIRGRKKNTVVFKRDGARAVFAKADVATKKMMSITVPESLQEFFSLSAGNPVPTRFRIRVLSARFAKQFTSDKLSPVVSAPRPPKQETPTEALPDGDCDGDGAKNKVDNDDDNDGLGDGVELSLSLDPCVADTDDDGVLDKWEFDCDRDGILNRDTPDDDGDLLADTEESRILSNPCVPDTDGDGVEDGYEYRSATDLNDDEHQQVNSVLAYPYKTPYPNPGFADGNTDYDGDSLTLKEEYDLWVYTYSVTKTDPRDLNALSYSDGEQYTRSTRIASGPDAGRRQPTLPEAGYDKFAQFVAWAGSAGYRTVYLEDPFNSGAPWWNHAAVRGPFGLFDMNRDGAEDLDELFYYDELRDDDYLSDDERDEDADGLTNYDETHGRMLPQYWTGCYAVEQKFQIAYAKTSHVDGDTDGDGVLDGADDQDHDDIPNLMELSRAWAAKGNLHPDDRKGMDCKPKDGLPSDFHFANEYGRVNPFNPCLPRRLSRTCPKIVNSQTGAPFDGSPDWHLLN